MTGLIKWLDDPYLVVKFQRFFGVLPNNRGVENTPEKKHQQSCNGNSNPSGSDTPPVVHSRPTNDVINGLKNGDAKNLNKIEHSAVLNGHSPTTNLRHRGPSDSQAENFEKTKLVVDETTENTAGSIAWDIVSNQERGIEGRWETEEYIIKNKLLYYVFNFGANLGNEIFYITFFPFWLWNIDSFVGRRVCIFWALFMYLGQVTKDILKIPRPASPPVIRLEKLYALEYGMPSTHAMVGAGFPFSILLLTWERYIFPFEYGLAIAVLWTTIVCCSRLYLGMHSVLDVVAGLLYVFSLMPVVFPHLQSIDDFLIRNPFSPVLCVAVPVFLGVYYPKLDRWSTARGDTTVILSVASGLILGMWLSYHHGYMKSAPTPPPYEIIYPDLTWGLHLVLRMIIGVLILVITRQILKPISFRIACLACGKNPREDKVYQNLGVELPYKYITYTAVAFNAVYLAPLVFRYLNIERATYFTEI